MNAAILLAMIALTIVGAFGALFIKLGAERFRFRIPEMFLHGRLWIGAILYITSAIGYIALLKYIPLSLAYPLTSMTYIWVCFLAVWKLKEHMNIWKWLGIGCIILGIIVLSIGA